MIITIMMAIYNEKENGYNDKDYDNYDIVIITIVMIFHNDNDDHGNYAIDSNMIVIENDVRNIQQTRSENFVEY